MMSRMVGGIHQCVDEMGVYLLLGRHGYEMGMQELIEMGILTWIVSMWSEVDVSV